MKGWKVITKYRQSCRASDWGIASRKWSVYYPKNVEVFPKVKGSKLFFFSSKEEASRFLFDKSGDHFAFSYDRVVPCIAKGVSKAKWISGEVMEIDDFWQKRSKVLFKQHAPEGTYLAKSITCLE